MNTAFYDKKWSPTPEHEDRLDAPLRWKEKKCEQCGGTGKKGFGEAGIGDCSGCGGKGKRGLRIFVNSMSDLFHEDVPFEFIDKIFAVMALCGKHTFQVLTKRPARMLEYLTSRSKSASFWRAAVPFGWTLDDFQGIKMVPFPLPNLWLGVSIEDQKTADERIPLLLDAPAAVRWISYEPGLGPVSFRWMPVFGEPHPGQRKDSDRTNHLDGLRKLDWIVCGGESGPGARPFRIEWARDVIAQCKVAGVPCFVKQLGANPVYEIGDIYIRGNRKGGDPAEWPADLRVREYPNASQRVGG